jgi:DNA-binding response OmpR family regulator
MTRCLIVDENREWRGRTRGYLANHGFETIEADNNDAAFERFVSDAPDVVVVGSSRASEFIRQLFRHSEGSEPIVLLCPEQADIASVGNAIWSGASDYLVKPYSQEMFDAKLRQTGIL